MVVDAVAELADPARHRPAWLEHHVRDDEMDDLDAVVHTLFDDTDAATDPGSLLGSILVDESEVEPLHALGTRLGALIEELGDASDATYLTHPAWPDVVDAARRALESMRCAPPTAPLEQPRNLLQPLGVKT